MFEFLKSNKRLEDETYSIRRDLITGSIYSLGVTIDTVDNAKFCVDGTVAIVNGMLEHSTESNSKKVILTGGFFAFVISRYMLEISGFLRPSKAAEENSFEVISTASYINLFVARGAKVEYLTDLLPDIIRIYNHFIQHSKISLAIEQALAKWLCNSEKEIFAKLVKLYEIIRDSLK